MSARDGVTRLACVVGLAAGPAAMVWRAGRAAMLGPEDAVVWFLLAYAVCSTVGVSLSGAFTATQKAALIGACVGIASVLTLAVTGGLGALSLPLIVVGPSLPFLAASQLPARPPLPDADADSDPSPTLSALLRGKRLRAAGAVEYRKPISRRDEFWF